MRWGRGSKKVGVLQSLTGISNDWSQFRSRIKMSLTIFEMCFLLWLHNFFCKHNSREAVDPCLPSRPLISSGHPNRPLGFLVAIWVSDRKIYVLIWSYFPAVCVIWVVLLKLNKLPDWLSLLFYYCYFITVPEALCFVYRLCLFNSESFGVAGDELCISFPVSLNILPFHLIEPLSKIPTFLHYRLVFCACSII